MWCECGDCRPTRAECERDESLQRPARTPSAADLVRWAAEDPWNPDNQRKD